MPDLFSRHVRNPKLWQIALAGYWLALLVATHLPVAGATLRGGVSDKFAHVAAFAVLAAVFATTWQLTAGRLTFSHLCWVWVVVVLYGALDEWTQDMVGRQASFADWLANASGAALGLALFAWLRRRNFLKVR